MKRQLFALTALSALAAGAQAQTTNVEIYGAIDGGVRHVTNATAAGGKLTTIGSIGTYNANRLGFRGVEDLGGGLKARFHLENGFNSGTGALDNTTNRLFNRIALVGLDSSLGSVDIGHQYNIAFKTALTYDPFAIKFTSVTALIPSTAGVRNDNSIQYTGNFGPVTARVEYALGETTSFSTGAAKAVGALYRSGPILVGAAYTRKDFIGFEYDHWTVGGAFTVGPARIFVGHTKQEQSRGATGDAETTWTWLGANYAVTPAVEVIGAVYRTKQEGVASAAVAAPATLTGAAARPAFTGPGDKNVYIIAATYAFSKRTNLYVELDRAKLDGALRVAAPRDSQTGFSVGINHVF